jgi:hypothetical protein
MISAVSSTVSEKDVFRVRRGVHKFQPRGLTTGYCACGVTLSGSPSFSSRFVVLTLHSDAPSIILSVAYLAIWVVVPLGPIRDSSRFGNCCWIVAFHRCRFELQFLGPRTYIQQDIITSVRSVFKFECVSGKGSD